tara:strand:+ start:3438 stop:3656 length:219 start_codon:yes stop_codon:yes gene_type:complete
MPIRRTFRRKAKNGLVKADGGLWEVKKDGEPYNGKVVLKINIADPVAYKELSPCHAEFLELSFLKTLHETNL